MILPPQVEVAPHDPGVDIYTPWRQQSAPAPTSALFRVDCAADTVMDIALGAPGARETFRVMSAGCSYGPELDTVFALTCKNSPATKVEALGVDVHKGVLWLAAAGLYRLRKEIKVSRDAYAESGANFDQTLAEHGIALDKDPAGEYRLNSRRARAMNGSSLTLLEADIRGGLGAIDGLAHLVLCNNVIYYYTPEVASEIALDLAKRVSCGGVLSFGRKANNPPMNLTGAVRQDEWADTITPQLNERGFTRIDDGTQLIAFKHEG